MFTAPMDTQASAHIATRPPPTPTAARAPLRIGGLELASPAVQAALSGYSDLPMRRVARRWGAALTINEVVLDQHVIHSGKLQREILRVPDDDHPVGGQLLGSEPRDFALAARLMAEAGYDLIDLNFGCPVKKVLGRCRGGFLLSEPSTALEIVARVREALPEPTPLTLKMRRGMDDSAESEEQFWQILEGAWERGVAAVCVHGRTVRQRYVGPSRWSFLAEVRRRFPGQTLLGSGDVFTATDAVALLHQTGVDGVWCARGSIGAPWIFRQIDRLLAGEDLGPPPSITEQRAAVELHLAEALAAYGPQRGARMFRKFGIKYSESHPAGVALRDAFIACRDEADLQAVLDQWYDPAKDYGPLRHRQGPGDLVAAGACGA